MKNQINQHLLDEYAAQLQGVLDRDIESLQAHIDRLNELRSLLIKQDVNALSQLLTSMQYRNKAYYENIIRRNNLREKIAALIGDSKQQITLSRIEKYLTGDKQVAIAERKRKLQSLAGMLKKEYTSTQMLLIDCARFNRLLLKCLFDNAQAPNTTYRPTGNTERHENPVFMNVQF